MKLGAATRLSLDAVNTEAKADMKQDIIELKTLIGMTTDKARLGVLKTRLALKHTQLEAWDD